MKGIKSTILGEVSKDVKVKLDLMVTKQEERLQAMMDDYRKVYLLKNFK